MSDVVITPGSNANSLILDSMGKHLARYVIDMCEYDGDASVIMMAMVCKQLMLHVENGAHLMNEEVVQITISPHGLCSILGGTFSGSMNPGNADLTITTDRHEVSLVVKPK
jgi:hypothetical protein